MDKNKRILRRIIRGNYRYWNSTGWTDRIDRAREYTPAEAATIADQMHKDSVAAFVVNPSEGE